MRVVVVVDWLLKYACEQASALSRAGHDVALVHRTRLGEFDGNQAEADAFLDLARESGVTVRTVQGENRSIRGLTSAVAARLWLKRWKPDVIHVHPNGDPWLTLVFARLPLGRPAPLVLTIHDPTPHPGHPTDGALRSWMERAWERRASGFVVHGEELRRLARHRTRDKPVGVIPHGVRVREAPLLVPSAPSLLLFGRLEPYKGIAVLMEAMPLVWAERPEVRLVIAGTGQSEGEVIDHPHVEKRLRYISEDELPELFAEASLILAPYTEASQSGVVSLAIGQGIPVVVSDQGSLSDLAVFDEAVAPAGDPAALATAILALVGHGPEQREHVLEVARRTFSWDATAQSVTPFYERLTHPSVGREISMQGLQA